MGPFWRFNNCTLIFRMMNRHNFYLFWKVCPKFLTLGVTLLSGWWSDHDVTILFVGLYLRVPLSIWQGSTVLSDQVTTCSCDFWVLCRCEGHHTVHQQEHNHGLWIKWGSRWNARHLWALVVMVKIISTLMVPLHVLCCDCSMIFCLWPSAMSLATEILCSSTSGFFCWVLEPS